MLRQRFCPLELSAIMTFALLAILTLTTGMAWKERSRLVAENTELRERMDLVLYLNAENWSSDARAGHRRLAAGEETTLLAHR
jgi:hypothetical protein